MIFSGNLRRGALSVIIISLLCSFSFAQKPKFFINADFANFRYDKDNTYLEFYYSFTPAQFKIVKVGDKNVASAIITLYIKSKKNDSIISVNKWKNPINITDTSLSALEKPLTGVQGFKLAFGEYSAYVSCYDENNPKSNDSLKYDLKAVIPSDKIAISDIQLSSQIQQVPKNDNNIFYKNTLEVIPHPNAIFGLGLPIMYLYVEAYNLLKIKAESYSFTTQVFEATGEMVRNSVKNKKKVNESSVEVSTVNCSDLPSGAYVVKTIITDLNDTTNFATSVKKFYVYNPQIAPSKSVAKSTSMTSNEYAIKTETEIDREYEIAKYIALSEEKDEYAGLTTLESKRVFMMNFWNRRDKDNDPLTNVIKERYLKGIKYVNQNYRTGQREGWKTDRGRVYLVYGPPDEIERHPNEVDSKPYEVWNYHSIDGGVVFAFIDKSSMGDYVLVHSNYRNEISDDDWQDKLK